MNNKAVTVSLALAAFAVFMIYSWLTSQEEQYKAKYGAETTVVVAKTNIREMEEIHPNMLEIVTKPKQFVEPGKASSKDEVVGFIAAVNIRKGEQVTLNKIVPPGVKTGLSRQITPGKRAISIPVSDESGVNRLIKPGDRVDLIANIDATSAGLKGVVVSKVVLQDVLVLAVGEWITSTAPRKVEKDDLTGKDTVVNLNVTRNYSTIVLEVDPSAALELALIRSSNLPITVVLRNNDDTEKTVYNGVTIVDLLGSDLNKIRAPAMNNRP
jgi:pilus assembly protein CpaB